MKKVNSKMILRILACAYLLVGLVFVCNMCFIELDFKPILPASLTNLILKLLFERFIMTCFVSFIFGCLTGWLLDSKK